MRTWLNVLEAQVATNIVSGTVKQGLSNHMQGQSLLGLVLTI